MQADWIFGLLGVIALLMAVATAFLVRVIVDAAAPPRRWLALFLLAMMGEMWIPVVTYLWNPSIASLVAGLAASGGLMAASFAVVFLAIARRDRNPPALPPDAMARPIPLGLMEGAFIGILVLVNEFLMGWGLQLAAGVSASALASGGAIPILINVVDSPWFLFTMAAEMGLTVLFLWGRLSVPLRVVLLAQSVIMFFSAPALTSPLWVALSIYASSGAMVVLFVFLMEHLYRHHQLAPGFSTYIVELLAVYAMMMAGLFVWQYYGDASTFALAILIEMVVFYVAVARPEPLSRGVSKPWQLRPNWAFSVLALIFVAEIFMGAVLDVQIDPADYLGGFPLVALSGPPGVLLVNALSNGFWFLATVTASTWFLIMMGLEMGTLVVFKFREVRNLEKRIQLGLMMGCYAAFVVFYPSIYFALYLPNAPNAATVPVLGWSMGLGSYPVAPAVFSAILLSYIITGALVVLFGRRVICSIFCSAPLMYQGTTVDSMKSFNRSEWPGKKYLGSRMSQAYTVTSGLVMGSLVVTSVLSYLDTLGIANVYIQGTDPSVFLFTFSFAVLWYVMFVTIPYTGNYNCVTMGWCYTGTFAQAFQKVGFFKLKVRDRQVCRDCTTLDCAKGCPVGLVDMVGFFRTKGEYRSTKCCGVGDCVEDCPHDNLYVSDFRHWVRRRLGRPETRPRRASRPLSLRPPSTRLSAAPVSPQVPAGLATFPMAPRPTHGAAARASPGARLS